MVSMKLLSTAGSRRAVVALDAGTGGAVDAQREQESREAARGGCQAGDWDDERDERILYVTPGYRLIALDAKTGVLVSS